MRASPHEWGRGGEAMEARTPTPLRRRLSRGVDLKADQNLLPER